MGHPIKWKGILRDWDLWEPDTVGVGVWPDVVGGWTVSVLDTPESVGYGPTGLGRGWWSWKEGPAEHSPRYDPCASCVESRGRRRWSEAN